MLSGLNHLTLAVADLDRSFDFYCTVLGFRPRARWARGAYLSIDGLWLCLSLDSEMTGVQRHGYTHYAFSVAAPDFAALVSRLRSYGLPEWQPNTSEGDSFYFLDPDGHPLEIHVGTLESRLAACRQHPYTDMQFFD
jgi:catechol 2,3-dioxygenase-like lactoylglutathione lyase family enzyme